MVPVTTERAKCLNDIPLISNLLPFEISHRRRWAPFAEPARVGAGGYADWPCLALLDPHSSIQALRLSIEVSDCTYWYILASLGTHSASDLIELDVGLLIAVA